MSTTEGKGEDNVSLSENLKNPREEEILPNKILVLENHKHGITVAKHYNQMNDNGLDERFNSPIFYMRNFNNWVKSVLINEFAVRVTGNQHPPKLKALDICCGKGGDLIKWNNSGFRTVVFADIANVSIDHCKQRYTHFRDVRLDAEFIVADCSKERLRSKYKDPTISFDIVSCQFGFHYCFESLPQAECMLQNISECLRQGGYFIGTIPNAHDIIAGCKREKSNSFGNSIFNIELHFDPETEGYPLFGAKYDFKLKGVVDCPEFLVNFDVFEKLALKYNLHLVMKKRFSDVFIEYQDKYLQLAKTINIFEVYPPLNGKNLISNDESDYEHAKKYLETKSDANDVRIGTMSKCEWEATSIYLAFAFEKRLTS